MREIMMDVWAWFTALFLIIDFFLIIFLLAIILVILLSPLVILIGVPILMDVIWKKKY